MKKEEEVQKLSQEFKKIRQCGGKIIFPSQLKRQVVSLLEEGYSISTLCKQLSLCKPQVYSWKSEFKQVRKPHINSSYEIKTIPIISSIPESDAPNLKQTKKIRPKMLFRFLSLKISWG